jgi:hypothetical protein
MSYKKTPLVLGVKEHLLAGNPITHLECTVLFGLTALTPLVSDMRKEGYVIKSRRIPFVAALRRINESAVLTPPHNFPAKEVTLTEYRLTR